MNRASFYVCVQECLDLRQDPLDDANILAFVEEHPEFLEALVDLRAVGLNPVWPKPMKFGKLLYWKGAALVTATAAAVLAISFLLHTPDEISLENSVGATSPTLLAKAPVPKFLSVQVTRSTSSSSKEVIHHSSSRSARVLSVNTKTTHNIH